MIDLRGSRFTDIMPENMASQPETQAFAYALGRQIEKLCAYADGIHIYAAVDSMPEKILDVLAVELRTPAYNQKFSIEVKRALVEGTLTFYTHMGTPAACNQIIETIFGNGFIKEWFDYDGEPHHFRAYVWNSGQVNQESLTEFRRVLKCVKRLSSWLDSIITVTELETEPIQVKTGLGPCISRTELPDRDPIYDDTTVQISARAQGCISIVQPPEREAEFRGKSAAAARGYLKSSLTVTALPEIRREEMT